MTEPTTFYRMHHYTRSDVLRERQRWAMAYANGYTRERFGQWFWNRYADREADTRWSELFYAQHPNDAARMLLLAIDGYQRP